MLLTPYNLRHLHLNNRVVMAPMTRNRAIGNIPNNLMADYYSQRASAGLIITEGVSPSPNGLGFARVPGMFTERQAESWKQVTDAVTSRGGKIFMQLMHTGRVSHPFNLPVGAHVVAPSSSPLEGMIWTDGEGLQPYESPVVMDQDDINDVINDFVQAGRWAISAGFDGVEINAGNGYLFDQFLSPATNQRTDEYGGDVANRSRFLMELTDALIDAIGAEHVGIKISPYASGNGMYWHTNIDETYRYLATMMSQRDVAYLHVSNEDRNLPHELKTELRHLFEGTFILSGGFTHSTAQDALDAGLADLIAFGKSFIANPDLVERFHKHLPLNFKFDASKFYTAGPRGFTDYPVFAEEFVSSW